LYTERGHKGSFRNQSKTSAATELGLYYNRNWEVRYIGNFTKRYK
jgi:hypothetical protein